MENLGRYKTELEKEIKERRSEVTKEDEKMRTAKFRELGSKMRDLDVINREISRDSNFKFYSFSMRNMTIFYGIMFIFSISIIIRFMERSKKEEERVASLQQEKISSELEYLKQQINPHFLFNALNSIYSLTILNSESSSDAVLKLASILRYMLYETDKDRVQLEDEIEVIENYLGLQQLRLTSKTEVNFTKIGNTEPYRIEPMLLIPILENAFKYGINSSKHTEINILLEVENDNLTFICENKIVKLKVDNKNSGIGIKNIRRRLDLLYEDNYTFKAGAKDDTFIVKLVLPLNETSIS
ncbi:MAG: sensor histidine kinase [Rikenellaceae bacterium]